MPNQINPPPQQVSGANVIRYAIVDSKFLCESRFKQVIQGIPQGLAPALAICQYQLETGFYLFGCDLSWQSVTDTWHETLEYALEQAAFEYVGVPITWREIS